MFKKEKWKIWSTDQNPRIRHCVANPFFSFSSSFSFSFFFFLFSVLYRSKISFLAEMAGTNQYNLISEAVRITAISVLVWALVQKILAGQNSLPRLWCFCWFPSLQNLLGVVWSWMTIMHELSLIWTPLGLISCPFENCLFFINYMHNMI